MVVTLDVDVNGSRSAVLSSRWQSLSIVLTDDDTEDSATLVLAASADLELPPRSASLAFRVDGGDVGTFKAHRVRGNTRTGTVSIEAASLSPDSVLRDQRDGSWEQQKVGDVLAVIADRADLMASIDPAVGDLPTAAAVQDGESDLAFARRLVTGAGGRLVIQDGRLIVTRGDRAREDLPALEVDLREDGSWVEWSRAWRQSVGVVRASYLLEDGSSTAVVEVSSGQEPRERTLPNVFPSREAAIAAASGRLVEGATSRDSVEVGGGLKASANVLQPLRIVGGEDRVPGGLPALIVRRVMHAIGKQAATTTLAASGAAPVPVEDFVASPPPEPVVPAAPEPRQPAPAGTSVPPARSTPGSVPDLRSVVERVAADNPVALRDARQNTRFVDLAVAALRAEGGNRWGWHRPAAGGATSNSFVSYYTGDGDPVVDGVVFSLDQVAVAVVIPGVSPGPAPGWWVTGAHGSWALTNP